VALPDAAGELAVAVLEVPVLAGGDDDDAEPELQPTMSAAIAAIATPPAAIRARLRENMVLAAPSQERPLARQYISVFPGERSGRITI